MKIGIIGGGRMGGTLTRRLAALGHDVSIANSRGPETLAELAAETGAVPVSITDAGRDADVMIIAIPEGNIPDLPEGLLESLPESGLVIDIGNYAPQQRDGRIDALENGVIESRWVEAQLGHPVIKAFNNVRPPSLLNLGKPAGTRGRVALPVAGDDPRAKAVVIGLIDQLGVKLDARGNVATDENHMSSLPGVFAAGDMRRGQSLVVWAIAEGRKAAEGIDRFLAGR